MTKNPFQWARPATEELLDQAPKIVGDQWRRLGVEGSFGGQGLELGMKAPWLVMKAPWLGSALLVLAACQSGSITVTGTARPPVDVSEVRVYAEPPAEYEVIAVLESAPGRGWSQQAQRDSALEDLKAKAASVGANGVLLTGVTEGGSSSGVGVGVGGGHGGVGVGFSRSPQALLGKAIFVKVPPPPPNQ